ncbi:MAG TPA: glycoside hydrolase family 2 TIM barrel-domain containing protein, partial [Dictyoglomaceae bacterium]|nr:glycoside hydrolase family 2 TIM barrel-domain containing protein [Dictyoglomaceae bacterium]
LNGKKIGETDNMFIPWAFNVKDYLVEGENELEVELLSPSKILEERANNYPVKLRGGDYSPRIFGRKAQYSFGWDWGPRLATSGIWKSVNLRGWDRGRIFDVWVPTRTINNPAQINIEIDIELEESTSVDVAFRIISDKPVLEQRLRFTLPEGRVFLKIPLSIKNPRLWFPKGYGEQHLYTVQLVLLDQDGNVLDKVEEKFGIRKVELVTQEDEKGESFIFRVNDIPIFAKGANFIPLDSFLPRVKEEDYKFLLTKLKEAGANMLRIWGGGVYEDDIFYDLCDELGIMVWQDFMFACAEYPDDEEFSGKVQKEAEYVVKRLRNHPSVVIWCGNNENYWGYHAKWWGEREKFWGEEIYSKILPDVCARLDLTRPYWFGSPYGGRDPNSEEEGDRHNWDVWTGWKDYKEYLKDNGRFISEFGFQAPPSLKTIKRFVSSEKELYPQSRDMEFHNKMAEGTERIIRYIARYFKITSNMEAYIYLSQVNQGLALKTGIEHWRNNKFHTSGALIWQWNDCCPVVSWSIIDYYKELKPAYYFVKRAFGDIKVNIEERDGKLYIFGVNDTLRPIEGKIEFGFSSFKGQGRGRKEVEVEIPENSSVILASIPVGDANKFEEFFYVILYDRKGFIVDRSEHFFAPFKHLNLPKAEILYSLEELDKGIFMLHLESDFLALWTALELDNAEWEDNYFNIYPKSKYNVIFKAPYSLKEVKENIEVNGFNLKRARKL